MSRIRLINCMPLAKAYHKKLSMGDGRVLCVNKKADAPLETSVLFYKGHFLCSVRCYVITHLSSTVYPWLLLYLLTVSNLLRLPEAVIPHTHRILLAHL